MTAVAPAGEAHYKRVANEGARTTGVDQGEIHRGNGWISQDASCVARIGIFLVLAPPP
jgi:hypothetical protein